jgi:dUTP pyrophosphatase
MHTVTMRPMSGKPRSANSGPVEVKIKRFDLDLPLPQYQTAGSVAIDLVARESVIIQPGQVGLVPLNIAIELPPGHWALLAARSSLHKKGLLLANGIGVGDEDFCGENDEYRAALLNYTQQAVTVERGDRLVQMIIMSRPQVNWQEVEHFGGRKNRGGFGSTGQK